MQPKFLPLVLAAILHSPLLVAEPFQTDAPANNAARPALLTLQSAMEMALQQNREIAAASREVDAVDGAVQQAGKIPNPELSYIVEGGRQPTRTSTIQLNQPIELGGKRSARMNTATSSREVASMELAVKRLDIRAITVTAFYGVLIAHEQHRLAMESLELAQRATNATAKRVVAGKISPVEESKARIAESTARLELTQAAGNLASSRQRLASTLGTTQALFGQVTGELQVLPPIPALELLIDRLKDSPAYQRARWEVSRRIGLTDIERAKQIPDVVLAVGRKKDEQLSYSQPIVGVSIAIPIFDRNQGNVREAAHRVEKAQEELAATEIQLHADITQAYQQFNVARDEVVLLQKDVIPGAQRVYEAAAKGFDYGKLSYLDMLDAQRTLAQAKLQYLRVLSDMVRAASELERLVGPLDFLK
ncbi:MAG: TolC family protein [Pseudomonadota bacterium]